MAKKRSKAEREAWDRHVDETLAHVRALVAKCEAELVRRQTVSPIRRRLFPWRIKIERL